MKKPGIPAIPRTDPVTDKFFLAIKDNIEIITGARSEPITTLPADATLLKTIAKLNELIKRINVA